MGAAADDLSALFDGSGFDAAWAEGARDLERRVAMATVVDEERGDRSVWRPAARALERHLQRFLVVDLQFGEAVTRLPSFEEGDRLAYYAAAVAREVATLGSLSVDLRDEVGLRAARGRREAIVRGAAPRNHARRPQRGHRAALGLPAGRRGDLGPTGRRARPALRHRVARRGDRLGRGVLDRRIGQPARHHADLDCAEEGPRAAERGPGHRDAREGLARRRDAARRAAARRAEAARGAHGARAGLWDRRRRLAGHGVRRQRDLGVERRRVPPGRELRAREDRFEGNYEEGRVLVRRGVPRSRAAERMQMIASGNRSHSVVSLSISIASANLRERKKITHAAIDRFRASTAALAAASTAAERELVARRERFQDIIDFCKELAPRGEWPTMPAVLSRDALADLLEAASFHEEAREEDLATIEAYAGRIRTRLRCRGHAAACCRGSGTAWTP